MSEPGDSIQPPDLASLSEAEIFARLRELRREFSEFQAELRRRAEAEHAAIHAGLWADTQARIEQLEYIDSEEKAAANRHQQEAMNRVAKDRLAGRDRSGIA